MSDSKCKWCSDVETVGQHCTKYEKFYDTEKYEKKYDPEYEEDIYSDDVCKNEVYLGIVIQVLYLFKKYHTIVFGKK